MPKVEPFHSSKPGTAVFHNNSECYNGNNIERRYWTSGKGQNRLCATCKDLNRRRK